MRKRAIRTVGYVCCEFVDEDRSAVIDWAKLIDPSWYKYAEIEGKTMGGNVSENLHLTIFYGLSNEPDNVNAVNRYIYSLNIESIEISGISSFDIKEHKAKIVFLNVDDGDGKLQKINKELSRFKLDRNAAIQDFNPHITVAYVKDNFDIGSIVYDGPKTLKVSKIALRIRNSPPL